MQYQRIKLGLDGLSIDMPFDDQGYYCPFCGLFHGAYGMYDDQGHRNWEFICPDCDIQPGCDDTYSGPDMTQQEYITKVRCAWLDTVGWEPEFLNRLKHVFGLSDDDINQMRSSR